jgi:hypothetical protein
VSTFNFLRLKQRKRSSRQKIDVQKINKNIQLTNINSRIQVTQKEDIHSEAHEQKGQMNDNRPIPSSPNQMR